MFGRLERCFVFCRFLGHIYRFLRSVKNFEARNLEVGDTSGDRIERDAHRRCLYRENTEPAVSVKRRGRRYVVEDEKLE